MTFRSELKKEIEGQGIILRTIILIRILVSRVGAMALLVKLPPVVSAFYRSPGSLPDYSCLNPAPW